MKKRFLTMLVALVLLVNLLPVGVSAEVTSGGPCDNDWCTADPCPGHHDGCDGPGCLICAQPQASASAAPTGGNYEPPPLTFEEKFNLTWSPTGTVSSGDGNSISYAGPGGVTLTDSWNPDGIKSSTVTDASGNILSLNVSQSDQVLRLSLKDKVSGGLWLWDKGTAVNFEALGNDITRLTYRDLTGVKAPVTTLAMQYFDLQYENNPDGTTTWFMIRDNKRIDIGTYRNDNLLTAGCSLVDITEATSSSTTTDADGNDVTVYTFEDKTTATHTLYPDGSYRVTITKADGSSETCTYDADGKPVSQGVTFSSKQLDPLVDAALGTGASNILIDAGQTSVTFPGSTAGNIASQTGASLTVSTSVADVTIPNSGLADLAAQGGDVTVSAQQDGNIVTLDVSAGGKSVDKVPGGITLTVPGTPGTTATLVSSDGTRQPAFSAAQNNELFIPLTGSVTVELQANSQGFDATSSGQWKSEAIMWASSRGIISGNPGSANFDPDAPLTSSEMSAMLLRALGYFDVDGSGIAGSQPGNGSISREQLITMLWRYAGSPGSTSTAFSSTDSTTRSMLQQILHNLEDDHDHSFDGSHDEAWLNELLQHPSRQETQDARKWYSAAVGNAIGTAPIDSDQSPTLVEACAALQATTASSIIRDTDMAEEITQYTKNNILLQAAQSMLAQANQTPQGVLQLLQ